MFSKQVKLICAILFVYAGNVACDYCNNNGCENPRDHILCLYPRRFKINRNVCNGNIIKKWVAYSDIPQIIEAHYKLLEPLDGPSTTKLIWDEELAKMAQAWANQCPSWEYDDCHSLVSDTTKPVYQNVLEHDYTLQKFNWKNMLQSWFNADIYRLYSQQSSSKPYKDYPSKYVYYGNNPAVTRVGCGVIINEYHIPAYASTNLILVCNYS